MPGTVITLSSRISLDVLERRVRERVARDGVAPLAAVSGRQRAHLLRLRARLVEDPALWVAGGTVRPVGTACVTGNAPWRWNDVITDLGMRQADLAHQGAVMVVRTVADIDEAYRSGRGGLVFGLEAATPIENEIDRLDVLYGLGIRQIGIAYSDANGLGSGLSEVTDGGLTAFGRRAVTRMNRLGLAIDLSHSSDRTALDVCRHSDKPVFLTHAGARAVWNTSRMKPDHVLRAVAGTGGVVGMSAAP